MSQSLPLPPTNIFLKRSPEPSETDSNGCVVCSSNPECPSCASNEHCVQTVQSCTECPRTYCKALSGSSSSSSGGKTNIGGIVGGVVAGLVVLSLGTFLFYKYYFKKKLAFNRVHQKEYYLDDDIEIQFHHNYPSGEDPLEKPSSRTSLATTVFTRASNIIPIAYIPGVTIGATTNSKSNISSNRASTVSQANTIDSELVGDRFSKASIVGNPSLTTTAIRAKPKLVSVNSYSGTGGTELQDGIPGTAVSAQQLGGVRPVRVDKNKKKFALQDALIEEEESEEDVDDLESIVVPKEESIDDLSPFITPPPQSKDTASVLSRRLSDQFIGVDDGDEEYPDVGTRLTNDDYEPFIIDDGEEEEDEDDDDTQSKDSRGSVLLEVEIDNSSPFDPFDDKYSLKSDNENKKDE